MTAHLRQTQQLSTDALIELYTLDTSPMTLINGVATGGAQYCWTPGSFGGANLVFQGVSYTPLPIEGSGFEWTGQGKLPQPRLTMSNIGGVVAALVIQNKDLVGSFVTRIRVFESNLDNNHNADANLYFEPDEFVVNRKSRHDKSEVIFELRASFDAQGILLPRRQIIRDTCLQTYRHYNPGTNSFVQGSCPWAGSNYYDAAGTGTSIDKDVCGKKLTDCKLRFGVNAVLPTYAFPGAGIAQGTP